VDENGHLYFCLENGRERGSYWELPDMTNGRDEGDEKFSSHCDDDESEIVRKNASAIQSLHAS
jgi:hypothetical protein